MSIFWDRFYSLSVEKDGSPNATAKKLKIPSGSITAWKGGSLPRAKTVNAISVYFGVSIDYILGRTNDPAKTLSSYERVGLETDNIKHDFQNLNPLSGPVSIEDLPGYKGYGQKEKPALSKEDEQKDVDEFLDGLTPAELVDLISKASAKLKGDGLL